MGIYIGIYGGHQRSVAVALDNEQVISCCTGKSLNLHTFSETEVAQRLEGILGDLSNNAAISAKQLQTKTEKLVLALPGAAMEIEQEKAHTCLVLNGWEDKSKYSIVDDTWAGLFGGALNSHGICAFGGTGASVFVGLGNFILDNKWYKIDGWGPILGDHGSGFQLMVDTFRFLGKSFDKGQEPELFQDILQLSPEIRNILRLSLEIRNKDKVQIWFDELTTQNKNSNAWRVKFASLAEAVTQAADRQFPNPDAVNLVRKAATDMAETIEIALERFKEDTKALPIVFQGGMFEHSRLYRALVANIIQSKYKNQIGMGRLKTSLGAALMGYTNFSNSIGQTLLDPLLVSVDNLKPEWRKLLVYTD